MNVIAGYMNRSKLTKKDLRVLLRIMKADLRAYKEKINQVVPDRRASAEAYALTQQRRINNVAECLKAPRRAKKST